MRRPLRPQVVFLLTLALLTSCRTPTSVMLVLSSDVACADSPTTTVSVSRQLDDSLAPSLVTQVCQPDGRIGTLVVLPAADRDEDLRVRVVTSVGNATCEGPGYGAGCIVSRRQLRFIAHEELTVPIAQQVDCAGVACGATTTCRQGQCVDSTVDLDRCKADPDRCGAEIAPDPGAAGSGGQPGAGGGGAGGAGGAGSGGAAGGGMSGGSGQGGTSGVAGMSGKAGGAGAAGEAGAAGATGGEFLVGVNLSGGENLKNGSALGVTYGTNYFYPTAKQLDYYRGKGLTTIRLPFRWKRLQQALLADLDAAELGRLDTVVALAEERAMRLVLDPHDNATYEGGGKVGSDAVPDGAFADFWGKVAAHYKGNPLVVFGLMNEPTGITTTQWLGAANAAIAAIRKTGATNLVLVPGVGGGAVNWFTPVDGASNADTMPGVVDPGYHFAFEVHQYLDADSTGTHPECASATIGSERLAPFTAWLKQHGHRAFLSEMGAAYDTTCLSALDDALTHLDQNRDAWMGWTYWAGGPFFKSYYSSVEPLTDTEDRPPMAVLVKHTGP